MADFEPAFQYMIKREGGFINHTVAGDRGGQTYAGIARRSHPDWIGWTLIDANKLDDPALTGHVRAFYKANFWDRLRAEDITNQDVATSLFDFAVNTGVKKAVTIAQLAVQTTPDGIIGPRTLQAINDLDPEKFLLRFTIGKIGRYAAICNADRSQTKFLLGWINRSLQGAV
ncbi:MAG: N-acetylmuramidase [Magnetococcales bacterium]|nr:N-acetylmuramidase [Magnetococcales bacterium]